MHGVSEPPAPLLHRILYRMLHRLHRMGVYRLHRPYREAVQ